MCHGCHACQSGLRAHVQRAKAASIFQLGLPACQRRANYSIWRAKKPKGVPVFQLFFKRKYFFNFKIFQSWLTFANFKNIWAILENLSHETKNLNFDIYCLFLLTCYKSCFSHAHHKSYWKSIHHVS